jgi:hypothetical protein
MSNQEFKEFILMIENKDIDGIIIFFKENRNIKKIINKSSLTNQEIYDELNIIIGMKRPLAILLDIYGNNYDIKDILKLILDNGGTLYNENGASRENILRFFYKIKKWDLNNIKLLIDYKIINNTNINFIINNFIIWDQNENEIRKRKNILLLYIAKNYKNIHEIEPIYIEVINDDNRIESMFEYVNNYNIDNRLPLVMYQQAILNRRNNDSTSNSVTRRFFESSRVRRDWIMAISSCLSRPFLYLDLSIFYF